MSPEASWQASSIERHAPRDRASDLNFENQSVEALLRRLITRVQESERRYNEALGELHARLDQLSKSTESVPASALGDSEEAETLERLRSQLSGLAERLEHPEPAEPRYEGFAKLDKVLSEARKETAGLTREANPFAALEKAVSTPEAAFSFPAAGAGAGVSAPAIERPALASVDASLDRRLVDMAERLERSIGEAMPTAAIQAINARMDNIARTFDQALRDTPKIENLRSLERQIIDMGQRLGEIGAHASRINVVADQLHRLIERADDTAFHIETAASKAANEAARLVVGSSFGGPSAAERLEALHRDIMAMNEQSRATDDRLVDTLAAMHDSFKGLIQQVERVRQTNQAQPAPAQQKNRAAEPPAFQPAPGPSARIPASPRVEEPAPKTNATPPKDRSLRDRLLERSRERDEAEPLPAFGRSKRDFFADDALDLDEGDLASDVAFPIDMPSMSGDDLVAAARRAAQAAALRAEGRSRKPAKARGEESWAAPTGAEMPEGRKRSMLMVVAILLLLLSAGLLYSRLKSKPEAEAVPPSTEQSIIPPAASAPSATPPADAAPDLQAAPAPLAAPVPMMPPAAEASPAPAAEAPTGPMTSPDPAPEVGPALQEAEPKAQPEQMAPHSTTPSAETQGSEVPPVRVSEVPPTVLVTASHSLVAPLMP